MTCCDCTSPLDPDALDLAEELLAYAPAWANEKWDHAGDLAKLRESLASIAVPVDESQATDS